MADSNFYISQLDNLYTDPVKTNLWRVYIPDTIWQASNANGLSIQNFKNEFTQDEFFLHAQSAGLPEGIEVKTGTVSYFGMQKQYVTQHVSLHGSQQFTAIMPEDMRLAQALVNWNETLVRGGVLNDKNDTATRDYLTGLGKGRAGAADALAKALINTEIKVVLYNMREHTPILTATLINAMCTKVSFAPTALSYADASLGKLNFTLSYDRFNYTFHDAYSQVSAV